MMTLSPLLMSLAQSSSNVRCQPGGGIPSKGQPITKRQRLDKNVNPTATGTSAAVAIPIDDIADNNDEEDDDIKILIDDNDDDDDDGDPTVVTVDARGGATGGAPRAANVADASGFGPFVLMDLHEDAVVDVKGPKCKKILNKVQANSYNNDAT